MSSLLQYLQILGSILSAKMTGKINRQFRLILCLLLGLVSLGLVLQTAGGSR